MKTIGQILKDARVTKDYSLNRIEKITKIKSGFIDSIEKEDWGKLPAFPTVLGFVKSLAGTLGVDEKMATAVLKRDYPPRKLKITPKPDLDSKFAWSPKLTFIVGMAAIFLVLFGYLIFQYIHFVSPPSLSIDSPKENQTVNGDSVTVFGSTQSDAKIVVNNQPVMVSDDGKFSVSLDVVPATHEIDITATSRSGKITEVRRQVIVKSE
jgi:cytoskeletal protein RodZ